MPSCAQLYVQLQARLRIPANPIIAIATIIK